MTTPDLYDGVVFDDLDAAVAHVDSVGMEGWVRRAALAVEGVPVDRVYAGFSLGAGLAQILAFGDEGAQGLVLMHGAIGPHGLDAAAWPTKLRAQLHYSERDPWVEAPDVEELIAFAAPGALETFAYPGEAHLFGFSAHADYDPDLAERTWERVRDFLATV